jgi:hypothetical protein
MSADTNPPKRWPPRILTKATGRWLTEAPIEYISLEEHEHLVFKALGKIAGQYEDELSAVETERDELRQQLSKAEEVMSSIDSSARAPSDFSKRLCREYFAEKDKK